MQNSLKNVPEKHKNHAVDMLRNLVNKNIISLSVDGSVTLTDTLHTIPMVDFLGGVYQLKANISRYSDFFNNVLKHLTLVRNPKLVKMKNNKHEGVLYDTPIRGGVAKLQWIEL